MPIYEYECGEGHRFEVIEAINACTLTKCPTCGKKAHRIISAPEIPGNRGIWIFDRKTKREILHDK